METGPLLKTKLVYWLRMHLVTLPNHTNLCKVLIIIIMSFERDKNVGVAVIILMYLILCEHLHKL